jgi:putative transposase
LNRLFAAWTETVYHRHPHSETGQPPLARWNTGGPVPLPAPAVLAEAFLWEERRTVTKTATISPHGNTYQVDQALVGRKVELVFDPFDLARIEVRRGGVPQGWRSRTASAGMPTPKARPETPPAPPPKLTGIDYAALIDTAYQARLAHGVNYNALTGTDLHDPDSRAA